MDKDGVIELLLKASVLGEETENRLVALDLNPFLAGEDAVDMVDAKIYLRS